MGGATADADAETLLLLASTTPDKIPKDPFHFTYITYFFLGAGYLLPWISFIAAIDYFSYIYPETHVNRIFSVFYMIVAFLCLVFLIFYTNKSDAWVRINVGMGLFVLALLVVPVMDIVYIKGQVGLYGGFYVTVGAAALCGVADALVQGGVIGCAGELPEKYMQAAVSGTASSGVLVSVLRILTKAAYPQNAHGLRQSANLYFAAAIAFVVLCIVFLVTTSIFPGYVTEDVHSKIFKDWYSIILLTGYYVFDLIGKSFPAFYLLENPKVAFGCCIGRLLFYPLFLACLHGPQFLRTEIPVIVLTCLLGLTNGYVNAVMMILGPKRVRFEYSEIAGVLLVLFLVFGLASGSILAWFWVI